MADGKHRNDLYGDTVAENETTPAIPAATVVLLKDHETGPEVLMLHRTSKVNFGGMWVFPGGRIDPEDYPHDGDLNVAARNAAARETMEEASITVQAEEFVWFAHWTPPPIRSVRYTTWFFATAVEGHEAVSVDGQEIQAHAWIKPSVAIERHAKGEIDLVAPTWVTLYQLSLYDNSSDILQKFRTKPPKIYNTHIGTNSTGTNIAMWEGDSGYEDTNPDADGPTHRLLMPKDGFIFKHSAVDY